MMEHCCVCKKVPARFTNEDIDAEMLRLIEEHGLTWHTAPLPLRFRLCAECFDMQVGRLRRSAAEDDGRGLSQPNTVPRGAFEEE